MLKLFKLSLIRYENHYQNEVMILIYLCDFVKFRLTLLCSEVELLSIRSVASCQSCHLIQATCFAVSFFFDLLEKQNRLVSSADCIPVREISCVFHRSRRHQTVCRHPAISSSFLKKGTISFLFLTTDLPY